MTSIDRPLDDPFFRVLRERHPDVDVVLLPPVDPTPAADPPATVGQALAVQRHAAAVLDALWGRIGRTDESRAQLWWAQADPRLHRFVVKAAVGGLREGEGRPVTGDIARALLDLGWQPRPSPADQPSLLARVGALDVSVTGSATTVSVEILSDPLHLTPDTLHQLVVTS